MTDRPKPESLPEPELNDLLRRVDWRFLIDQEEAPLIADLSSGRDARGARLVGRGEPVPGAADVALTGFPTRLSLRAARDAVRLGGEIVCLWRVPRLGGSRRAATRLRHAGLVDVHVLWPGPKPWHAAQFWLPLDAPETIERLLADRPARSARQRLLRALWRAAAWAGLLAPVCAIGRLPAAEEEGAEQDDGISAILSPAATPLLLTGGARSINKVVGLPFAERGAGPSAVVKFARVPAADAALEREAAALRAIERDRPDVPGVPRLLAEGRRAGRHALAESAIEGKPLLRALSRESFEELAARVSQWLPSLVGGEPRSQEEWWPRLVGEPLAEFERNFGEVVAADSIAALRRRLGQLDALPEACEHRDCSPWNVVLDPDGAPGLHDWESAETHGLPGLDLAYFLANCAFILDGALESGRTRESYSRLLDPATPYGAVAAACTERYCARVTISTEDYARLRLLCWLVHSRSDHQHLTMAAAGPPSHEALRGSSFLGLIETELERSVR